MDESPYQSPQTDAAEMRPAFDVARDPVRRVAKYQRRVIFALFSLIVANVLMLSGVAGLPPVRVIAGLFSWAALAFAIFSVFMLAKELTNVGIAVLCAILMFVPLVSLVVLLILSQKAIKYLREHRVEVGFFGADPSRI